MTSHTAYITIDTGHGSLVGATHNRGMSIVALHIVAKDAAHHLEAIDAAFVHAILHTDETRGARNDACGIKSLGLIAFFHATHIAIVGTAHNSAAHRTCNARSTRSTASRNRTIVLAVLHQIVITCDAASTLRTTHDTCGVRHCCDVAIVDTIADCTLAEHHHTADTACICTSGRNISIVGATADCACTKSGKRRCIVIGVQFVVARKDEIGNRTSFGQYRDERLEHSSLGKIVLHTRDCGMIAHNVALEAPLRVVEFPLDDAIDSDVGQLRTTKVDVVHHLEVFAGTAMVDRDQFSQFLEIVGFCNLIGVALRASSFEAVDVGRSHPDIDSKLYRERHGTRLHVVDDVIARLIGCNEDVAKFLKIVFAVDDRFTIADSDKRHAHIAASVVAIVATLLGIVGQVVDDHRAEGEVTHHGACHRLFLDGDVQRFVDERQLVFRIVAGIGIGPTNDNPL